MSSVNKVILELKRGAKMNYTLKDFLNAYHQNPNIAIKGFKLTGYGSWRGAYEEPCIYIEEDESSSVEFSEIIEAIHKLTDGTVFHGWKGGEYTYDVGDPMNIEPSRRSYTDGEHETYIFAKCPELFLTLLSSRG